MFYFGYRVPEGTKTFWGCRAILDGRNFKHRYVDFVYDRQSLMGESKKDRDELIYWLESGVLKQAISKADELFKNFEIMTDMNKEFTLYEDEKGIVISNPGASYGYLYVSAYFKNQPEGNEDVR